MKNIFLRLDGKIVCEVFINTTPLSIYELFHQDLAVFFEPCAQEDVQVGWIKREDGVFIKPPSPATSSIPTTEV